MTLVSMAGLVDARTDPDQAARYVADTGVDALAVAVGNSHAMPTRDGRLHERLIETIADRLPVPLVLHGASGVPDDGLIRAVRAGITKVNVATLLNKGTTARVRAALDDDPALVDPRTYLGLGRDAMATVVHHLCGLLAGNGRTAPSE